MNDQTDAALIRDARGRAVFTKGTGTGMAFTALADALEAAERRADDEASRADSVQMANDMLRATSRKDNEYLLGRIEQAEADRDALAAVVERVRAARSNHPACDRHADGDPVSCGWKATVLDIDAALDAAPADRVLRERDAEKWDEGFDAGLDDIGISARMTENGNSENPYRREE